MLVVALMEKTIRRFTSFEEMKADEYRQWQAMPAAARIQAVSDITAISYAIGEQSAHVPRLQRTLVRIKRA